MWSPDWRRPAAALGQQESQRAGGRNEHGKSGGREGERCTGSSNSGRADRNGALVQVP